MKTIQVLFRELTYSFLLLLITVFIMNPKQIGIGILFLAVIAIAIMQFNNANSQKTKETSQNIITESPTSGMGMMGDKMPPENSMMTNYKDGTYKGVGHYISPAQEEVVDISVTLKDGVVTDATFDGKATNETSVMMQELFSAGFKDQVVGKPVDQIDLTVVNGASLTPQGFMDALQKVKEEAKA